MSVKWYVVYKELAERLDIYYDESGEAARRSLLQRFLENQKFVDNNSWISRISNESDAGIDPVQIFASLNDPKITTELRIRRVNLYLEILGPSI